MTTRPRPPRLMAAVLTGIIAAAATSGAVLGFGMRSGTPARGFNAIASLVLSDRAHGVWGWDSTVTLTGIALHVAMMGGWGMLFSLLAVRTRGWSCVAASIAAASGIWTVTTVVVLRRPGPGASEVLGPGQLVALHVVLAVALGVGMRFAHSALRSDPQRRAASTESS